VLQTNEGVNKGGKSMELLLLQQRPSHHTGLDLDAAR
jgi:hypothetical protein